MPIAESALLALGVSVTKAVVKCWSKTDLGDDLSESLIDALGERIPSIFDRRSAARQFNAMAEKVVKQALPLIQAEGDYLPPNEIEAAVLGVSETIGSVRSLDFSLLTEIDFDPTRLESNLLAAQSSDPKSSLSDGAQQIYVRLLRDSCNYIVELTTALPNFSSQSLIEVMRRESELSAKLDEALARLPRANPRSLDPDEEFDLRYRRFISRELNRLELFGITLDDSTKLYDLSVAYIALSASTGPSNAPRRRAKGQRRTSAVTAGKNGRNFSRTTNIHQDTPEQQVDEVLASGARHLIRGEAGSGKTTLLQWLAVATARGSLPSSLTDWRGVTPIYLQLRRYANADLPNPARFLDLSTPLIASLMPPGWVDRKLASGSALLLLDGVDEIPDSQRQAARTWLRSLLREYPRCRVIVTTRPGAIPSEWLTGDKFNVSDLLPMSMADISNFVTHWYDAARQPVVHNLDAVSMLNEFELKLTRVIRDTPALRNLASTPLLCAMLCALYKDRRTQLPSDRLALYRIALESLLERRDVERQMGETDTLTLTLREKEMILQDLAYWMIRRGRSDVERSDLLERLADRLSYMRSIKAPADAVYRHLLIRSGLIREPVEGRVDFIHRTFQEYLAAARAVLEGDIETLVDNALDDQWRETIILSAGHASPSQANRLISALVQAGVNDPATRHRLHLLAAACLETALELDRAVRDAAEYALERALPPRNMTEARAVASAGHLVAPMLASKNQPAATAVACVRSLALIGGDISLTTLESYGNSRHTTVIRELLRAWDYFDKHEYAARVLKTITVPGGQLTIDNLETLAAVHHFANPPGIALRLKNLAYGLGCLSNAVFVDNMELSSTSALLSLGDLSGFANLQQLVIHYAEYLEEVATSLPESLVSLWVFNAPRLSSIGSPFMVRGIRRLNLIDVGQVDLRAFAGSPSLEYLRVESEIKPDVSWVRGTPKLKSLELRGRVYRHRFNLDPPIEAPFDFSTVDNGNLESLSVETLNGVVDAADLPRSLQVFSYRGEGENFDVGRLPASESLQVLRLTGIAHETDWSSLGGYPNLEDISLNSSGSFRDLRILAELKKLQRVDLSDTSTSDLTPLCELTKLHELALHGAPIRDFDILLGVGRRLNIEVDHEQFARMSGEIKAAHHVVAGYNYGWYF